MSTPNSRSNSLFVTPQDAKEIYMVIELALGGELFSLLGALILGKATIASGLSG